jgi:hypothetical protein
MNPILTPEAFVNPEELRKKSEKNITEKKFGKIFNLDLLFHACLEENRR